jgi:uncharacterized repeat protein (TIGR03803 family)
MKRNMLGFVFRAALAIVSAPLLVSLILIGDAQASTEKVLYSFGSGKDGSGPVSSLIFDAAGNLYGTTAVGGANNDGTVFELTPGSGGKWTESVIHDFTGGKDGMVPLGGLGHGRGGQSLRNHFARRSGRWNGFHFDPRRGRKMET